jgi:hypothetical protein
LKIAINSFIKRSIESNQQGKRLDVEQIALIQESMEMELPNWYVEMMLNHDLINIEFEYLEYENEDMKSSISISNFNTIQSEINEAYPGLEIKSMGYINFGTCLEGSGNPIFINLKENDNTPVIRVYHDGIIKDGIIDEDGGNKLADNLSDFFDKSEFENNCVDKKHRK